MVSTSLGFLPTEAAASSTMGRDSATRVLRQSARLAWYPSVRVSARYRQVLRAERSDPDGWCWCDRGCQLGDLVELAVEGDRIAAAGERSHEHDRFFQW